MTSSLRGSDRYGERPRTTSLRPGPGLRKGRVALLGVILASVLGLMAWIVFGTSVLGVREIVVQGSRIASADEVRAVAGVAPGTPLLGLDTGLVAERVGSLPSVGQVDVRRSLPHTLVISVTERVPAAVAPEAGGGFAVVSADGVVFQHVPEPPAGVALIQVSTPGAGDPATMAALRVLDALTPELRALLAAVVAPTPTGISLALIDGRTVVWGDDESSDLKAVVATTLLDQAGTIIDVTVPDVPTVRG